MAMDIKILKAKCRLCGKCFLFELRKTDKEYRVTNMEEVVQEHYDSVFSTIKESVYHTAGNLQSDLADKKRVVGGYSYPRSGYPCKKDSPYHFHCCYCDKLEFDYTKNKGMPYGKWAGTSNIPDVELDEYGNAKGADFDLAKDGAFKGYRVIILNFAILTRKDAKMDKVSAELTKKGFEVIELRSNASLEERLKDYLGDEKKDKTQIWILSSSEPVLSNSLFGKLRAYYESGHGLYLLGDDEPSFAEANRFLKYFSSSRMEGDYPGKKLLSSTADIENPGIIKDHLVTTGIVNFFEGKTVAGIEIKPGSGLKPLIRGSNGEILACYYEDQGRRMIADGGYTRLYAGWDQAGNERYFSNVAAYLANIERFGYDPE